EIGAALANAGQGQAISFSLTAGDFALADAKTNIGLIVARDGAGGFDPAAVEVRNSSGASMVPRLTVADLGGNSQSLNVVELPVGTYSAIVRGEHGTTGAFRLQVF